jgi:hypothetical protein
MPWFFAASAVASLIGEHDYKTAAEAKCDVLAKTKRWRALVEGTAAPDEATTLDALQTAVPAVKQAVHEAVVAAVAATSTAAIQTTLTQVRAAVAAESLAGGADAATAATAAEGAVGAVLMERGKQLEATALACYAAAEGTTVSDRNATMAYHRGERYTVGGRRDGRHDRDDKVVEVKVRRTPWARVPAYDLVQLNVYMHLYGDRDGVLVEHMPDGSQRVTPVAWADGAEWARIDAKLQAVARELDAATQADVEALVGAVNGKRRRASTDDGGRPGSAKRRRT